MVIVIIVATKSMADSDGKCEVDSNRNGNVDIAVFLPSSPLSTRRIVSLLFTKPA